MVLEVTIYRYKTNDNYKKIEDSVSATPVISLKNTTTVVPETQEIPAYIPRADFAELSIGDNDIEYQNEFPADRTVILWAYTYDSNGYQVGHSLSNEAVTGFTINVSKACTLKYIATIEN